MKALKEMMAAKQYATVVGALNELKDSFLPYVEAQIQAVHDEVQGRWDNAPNATAMG